MAFSLSLDELGVVWHDFNANSAKWANSAKPMKNSRLSR